MEIWKIGDLGIGKLFDFPSNFILLIFIIPEFENIRWVGKLDKLGFEVSTGSACSTGTDLGTPTASAFKLTREEASRLIRVSSYVEQNEEDWKSLNQAFLEAHTELSSVSIISL